MKNISELLWDFKTSIFTSIFLVFFLGVYNEQKMHDERLEKQAYIYVSFMRDSEDVIKKLYRDCFGGQYEDIENYLEVLKEFKDCVKNNGIVSWNTERYRKENNENILREIDNLYEKMKKLNYWDDGICKKNM